MTHRIFIAIKTSEELDQQLLNLQNKLRHLPVRFIAPENMHITLVPPWNEKHPPEVAIILKSLSQKLKPFEIVIRSTILGPIPENPFMITAEIEPNEQLSDLKSQIEEHLLTENIHLDLETRPFWPHITLARFKKADQAEVMRRFYGTNLNTRERISAVTVMESHLTQMQAEYKTLHTIRL